MNEITRKDNLGRNLSRLQKAFPEQFGFFPKTFILPSDYGELRAHMMNKKSKTTYIVKPEASSQGKGIFLTRTLEDIDPMGHIIVQEYLSNPLLIDNIKFDLRIYVLVTCCNPLRIYLYRDGLARFATQDYVVPTVGNLGETFMHLTNYSLNKNSDKFVENDDIAADFGTKRSIQVVMERLRKEGYDIADIWKKISDVIIKTLIAVQPKLSHIYTTCFPNDSQGTGCFEVLGFDVILEKSPDGEIKPWLLEVNHSPSLNMDTPIDRDLKVKMLTDVFNILNLKKSGVRKTDKDDNARYERLYNRAKNELKEENLQRKKEGYEQVAKSEEHLSKNSGFDKIFPCEDMERYNDLILPVVMPETAKAIARKDAIQKQQEEKERKEREDKMKRTRRKIRSADQAGQEGSTELIRSKSDPSDIERSFNYLYSPNSIQHQVLLRKQQEAAAVKRRNEELAIKRQEREAQWIAERQYRYQEARGNIVERPSLSHEPFSSSNPAYTTQISSVSAQNPLLQNPIQQYATSYDTASYDFTFSKNRLEPNKKKNSNFIKQGPLPPLSPEYLSRKNSFGSSDPFDNLLSIKTMSLTGKKL